MTKRSRRVIAAGLIVLGIVLLVLAAETLGGLLLITAGVIIEVIGISLERKA